MRKALIVGIDYYEKICCLGGCVNDAHEVKAVLERHSDGSINFPDPKILIGSSEKSIISKTDLKQFIRDLFSGESEIALFYFAGHGYVEDTGGYLCASDCKTGDDGMPLSELMTIAAASKAKNKIIILDSCHSGIAGENPVTPKVSEISSGMTVLTASTAEQYSMENNGSGVFTSLLVDALSGAATNLVGDVTPGSIYAHIDQSLGPWAQRPMFKTNVQSFVSLRKATPPIELRDLQRLVEFFPTPGFEYKLDPSYEPERSEDDKANSSIPSPDPQNTKIFAILQKMVKVNLVRPEGAPHMWHAAMQSKACKLTVLGEHYRSLVEKKLI